MPSHSDDEPVKLGDVLDGKYRVERLLGRGGMGIVVAARHIDLNTRLAIKMMLPDAARSPDSVARFTREAKAACRLRSEHVARVQDTGTLPDGTPYMVMEFLSGKDLDDVVVEGGALGTSLAADYILQACEAVAEAHALGIVHRDLKLRNIFLTKGIDGSPLVKVLDFGLAKTVDTSMDSRELTQAVAVIGSPQYMSPEQMRATRDVDSRTDIWSLGICLYELLTAKMPFPGETVPEICSLVLRGDPVPPSNVPQGLAAIVLRCLEKDPAERFQDVGDLAAAIEPFGTRPGSAHRVRSVLQSRRNVQASEPPRHAAVPSGIRPLPSRAHAAAQSEVATITIHATRPRSARTIAAAIVGASLVLAGTLTLLHEAKTSTASPSLRAAVTDPNAVSPPVAPPPPPVTTASPPMPSTTGSTITPAPSATTPPRPPSASTRAPRVSDHRVGPATPQVTTPAPSAKSDDLKPKTNVF